MKAPYLYKLGAFGNWVHLDEIILNSTQFLFKIGCVFKKNWYIAGKWATNRYREGLIFKSLAATSIYDFMTVLYKAGGKKDKNKFIF